MKNCSLFFVTKSNFPLLYSDPPVYTVVEVTKGVFCEGCCSKGTQKGVL